MGSETLINFPSPMRNVHSVRSTLLQASVENPAHASWGLESGPRLARYLTKTMLRSPWRPKRWQDLGMGLYPGWGLRILGSLSFVACGRLGVDPMPDVERPADAAVADASGDASAPADCHLTVGGEVVGYRTGDIGVLDGAHVLQLADDGLCAAALDCVWEGGADVVQSTCAIAPCRMWKSVDLGGGWFALQNEQSGQCLYMANDADGQNAIVWECADADQMGWRAVCAGDDSWHLINKLSSKQLGTGGAGALGEGVVQSEQGDPTLQERWQITSSPMAANVVMTSGETDANAVWRHTTVAPPSTWTEPSFDDSAWSSGPAAFGDTVSRAFTASRTSWTTRDIWIRRSFSLRSLPRALSVKIFHDEAAEVFINGQQVTALTDWAQGYRNVDVPASVMDSLVVGDNTIAVHCQNFLAPQFLDVGLVTYTWQ